MTLTPSICQNVIFIAKKSLLEFRTKFVLFGYFWVGTRKDYCTVMFYISTLKVFQTQNFVQIKILKFGTKIALIGYLGLEFQKANVVFEISILEVVSMKRFPKTKNLNLGQKMHYLRIFGLQFNKNYYQIFN